MKRRVATGGKSIKARRRKTLRRRATPAVLRRKHSRDTELRAQLDHSKRERDEALAREAAIADVLKRRTRELDETREQQTATTNVLKVISRSAVDLQAVLDALAEFVASLCLADRVAIRLEKGGAYHHLASFGFSADQKTYMKNHAWRPDRSSVGGRAVLQGEAVHVEDIKDDLEFKLMAGRSFKNVRTILGVPLIRDSKPIGAMVLTRHVVQPFTDRHIELATMFAAQAVIAIENARLLNELRQRTDDLSESLEQQTATSEVLKVISSSPGDLKPVFECVPRERHAAFAKRISARFVFARVTHSAPQRSTMLRAALCGSGFKAACSDAEGRWLGRVIETKERGSDRRFVADRKPI